MTDPIEDSGDEHLDGAELSLTKALAERGGLHTAAPATIPNYIPDFSQFVFQKQQQASNRPRQLHVGGFAAPPAPNPGYYRYSPLNAAVPSNAQLQTGVHQPQHHPQHLFQNDQPNVGISHHSWQSTYEAGTHDGNDDDDDEDDGLPVMRRAKKPRTVVDDHSPSPAMKAPTSSYVAASPFNPPGNGAGTGPVYRFSKPMGGATAMPNAVQSSAWHQRGTGRVVAGPSVTSATQPGLHLLQPGVSAGLLAAQYGSHQYPTHAGTEKYIDLAADDDEDDLDDQPINDLSCDALDAGFSAGFAGQVVTSGHMGSHVNVDTTAIAGNSSSDSGGGVGNKRLLRLDRLPPVPNRTSRTQLNTLVNDEKDGAKHGVLIGAKKHERAVADLLARVRQQAQAQQEAFAPGRSSRTSQQATYTAPAMQGSFRPAGGAAVMAGYHAIINQQQPSQEADLLLQKCEQVRWPVPSTAFACKACIRKVPVHMVLYTLAWDHVTWPIYSCSAC